jgi:hypothetical protein
LENGEKNEKKTGTVNHECLKSKEKPMIQYSCYAEPLTKEQLKKMAAAAKN